MEICQSNISQYKAAHKKKLNLCLIRSTPRSPDQPQMFGTWFTVWVTQAGRRRSERLNFDLNWVQKKKNPYFQNETLARRITEMDQVNDPQRWPTFPSMKGVHITHLFTFVALKSRWKSDLRSGSERSLSLSIRGVLLYSEESPDEAVRHLLVHVQYGTT